MSSGKLISILEQDFKGAFEVNAGTCPNADKKSAEKYNKDTANELKRQMDKIKRVIDANPNDFNEKKIDEWINNKSSTLSKLRNIVLDNVKKNNNLLFTNFCSHVPSASLNNLIFNINKLILSIVVSKVKLMIDCNNENLAHQIVEKDKQIEALKQEHLNIINEHIKNSGNMTAVQQLDLERLNKQITDSNAEITRLKSDHENKMREHNEQSDKLTNERKQQQEEEITKLKHIINKKEETIKNLKETHTQKAQNKVKLSDDQKQKIEKLSKHIQELETEVTKLKNLEEKRNDLEKKGIDNLVNIIKTTQQMVNVENTKSSSNTREPDNEGINDLFESSEQKNEEPPVANNIPLPPPLAIDTPKQQNNTKSAVSPRNLIDFNFSNQSDDSPPSPSSVLRKVKAPSVNTRGDLLKQIRSPRNKKPAKTAEQPNAAATPQANAAQATPTDDTQLLKPRFTFKEAKARRNAEAQAKANAKEPAASAQANAEQPAQANAEQPAQAKALSEKEAESKYLKYKNKYLQLKKLHNL